LAYLIFSTGRGGERFLGYALRLKVSVVSAPTFSVPQGAKHAVLLAFRGANQRAFAAKTGSNCQALLPEPVAFTAIVSAYVHI